MSATIRALAGSSAATGTSPALAATCSARAFARASEQAHRRIADGNELYGREEAGASAMVVPRQSRKVWQ